MARKTNPTRGYLSPFAADRTEETPEDTATGEPVAGVPAEVATESTEGTEDTEGNVNTEVADTPADMGEYSGEPTTDPTPEPSDTDSEATPTMTTNPATPEVTDPFAAIDLETVKVEERPGAVFPVSDRALALAKRAQDVPGGSRLVVPIPGVSDESAQAMTTELGHCGPHLTPAAIVRAAVRGTGDKRALVVTVSGKPGRKAKPKDAEPTPDAAAATA